MTRAIKRTAMFIPVRCFTCNRLLADVKPGEGDVCCRRMVQTSTEQWKALVAQRLAEKSIRLY